jgi:hypothetical protein
MKVCSTQTLPNNIVFSIIEVENLNVQRFFDRRFQLVLEIGNKRILPKDKNKFCSFEDNTYLYQLKSDKYDGYVSLSGVPYHELMICHKSLEECNCTLMEYISMYNQGIDLKKELKKTYKI